MTDIVASQALADERIVSTLIRYLGRYRELTDSNKMKPLVSLMHRIVVSVGAEAFFFKVSTRSCISWAKLSKSIQVSGFITFKKILDDQRSLPPGQTSKDLIACINYILKKFFKNLQENPILGIETFWPKPRGKLRKLTASDSEDEASEDGAAPRVKVRQVYI